MTGSAQGKTLQLHYVDGDSDGMVTAEIPGWTGHVLAAPRARIADALRREEAGYAGAYLLTGVRGGSSIGYIGESDSMSWRIRSHEADKAWWTRAVLVTSTDGGLNTAYSRYLESRLLERATNVGRVSLKNKVRPTRPHLRGADRSYMDGFLNNLFMVFPAVGVDAFKQNAPPESAEAPLGASLPVFELVLPQIGLKARAVLKNGKFIVLKGSQARGEWVGVPHSYERHHRRLVENGVLRREGDNHVFNENCAFTSPSAAAAVVRGISTPGPDAWKTEGGEKTYKEWDAERLSEEPPLRDADSEDAGR